MKMFWMGVVASVAFATVAKGDVKWKGIEGGKHYAGPELSAAALQGKVVMVDCWGYMCPPCRALLPRLEAYWQKMRDKPFMLVGSHRQGDKPEEIKQLVDANKLTYPIYGWCGIAENEPSSRGLPFLYVVDAKGKVVYSGSRLDEAEAAVKEALKSVTGPNALCSVKLKKYKAQKNALVFGKNVESLVKTLTSDSNGRDAEKAAEAKEILAGIEESKTALRATIDAQQENRPAFALAKMRIFAKTWPSEGAVYAERIATLAADPAVVQCGKLLDEVEKCCAQLTAGGAAAVRAGKGAAALRKKYEPLTVGDTAVAREAQVYLNRLQTAEKAVPQRVSR